MDKEKLLAIKLADNEKRVRTKALNQLRTYVQAKSTKNDPFNEEDLIKLWKGLHYCMWMADKPILQEELSKRISDLINYFNSNNKQVLLFIKVYFRTIIREWNGIDKWRMDKFMMLMRDMMHQSLSYLKEKKWNKALVNKFNKILVELPLNINDDSFPDGVSYHVVDIYLEELAKFGDTIKPVKSVRMLQPFMKLMAISKKRQFVEYIKKKIFLQIIECSDVGLEPNVEKEMEEIKAFGLQSGENEDTSEYSLKFNYSLISKRLLKLANLKDCLDRNKKTLQNLADKFKKLHKNIYPIEDFNFAPLRDQNMPPHWKIKAAKKSTKKSSSKKNKKISTK